MRHIVLNLAASAALCVLAGPAQAAAVEFSGFAHGSEVIHFAVTGATPATSVSGSAQAGGFLTSIDAAPSITTYCVDLYQHIDFNVPYGDYQAVGSHPFLNANAYSDLARLYTLALPAVNNAVSEAAFQIAVWEIAYEAGSYDVAHGKVSFAGGSGGPTAALAQAATWLASLGSVSEIKYSIQVLESPSKQDVIYANRIPEPGTLALALAGLGGLGFIRRRAKA